MERTTLNAALDRAADLSDVGLRLLDVSERETRVSWADVRQRALETCGGLQGLGVRKGDRVALVYPTGEGFFAAFFGVLLAGAVPVPIYPPVRLGRLDEYHRRTAGMLVAVAPSLVLADRRVERILGRTMEPVRLALGCRTLADLPAAGGQPPPVEAEDLALIQFSSGTTADPKPVALTHRAILAQVAAFNGFWPDGPELRHSGVSWLPLYHDMGLVGCVFAALERPGSVTLLPPELFLSRPATWLRAISRYRATISPAPNFAYGLCVDRIRDEEMEGVDLSCWRIALNGAESVAPRVLRNFSARFARWGFRPEALSPVYGLSEACLAVTFSNLERPFTSERFDRPALEVEARGEVGEGPELVSVGRPLPGFEVEIRDRSVGDLLADGSIGGVWVRGPSLMEGYFRQPEATAAALVDGWLDTGDLGFLHRGELYLTGRAKDIIVRRGRNFSADGIEQAVYDVEGVRRGCVAAVGHLPEDGDREEVYLFVEIARDTTDEIRQRLAEKCRAEVLAACGLEVDRVEPLALGTLPRTSSGKIRRREALRRHLGGDLTPPGAVNPLTMVRALAQSQLARTRSRRRGPE